MHLFMQNDYQFTRFYSFLDNFFTLEIVLQSTLPQICPFSTKTYFNTSTLKHSREDLLYISFKFKYISLFFMSILFLSGVFMSIRVIYPLVILTGLPLNTTTYLIHNLLYFYFTFLR